MRCRHNYVFTQGYFCCTKCGHKHYGSSYKKKQGKKVAAGVSITVIIGIVGFLFFNGVIEFNQENLEQSIQNIPKELPSIPEQISKPVVAAVEKLEKSDIVGEQIKSLTTPRTSTQDDAENAISYINKLRIANGKNPITHDLRVYELSLARVKDMHEYGMDSTGHKMNLLSYEHVAGSVACYGGYCVFLGLNYGNYGEGCYTAEGQAYASRFDDCSPQQMQEYEKLLQEYEKNPHVTRSETEYQTAMNLYNKIENFRC